jgi:predicted lipid-binding transport protein (Tim44 family)
VDIGLFVNNGSGYSAPGFVTLYSLDNEARTYDKDGKLIEGNGEEVAEVNDVWTFARDTRSRDPNWKLIATESED